MNMHGNHMNEGTGEDSYARNSEIQALSITQAIPTVTDALEGLYTTMSPKCVMTAELGCASGPNALMMIRTIIDVTYQTYRKNGIEIPEIKVFLNDLHTNDFNTICRSLDSFDTQIKEDREGDVGRYFISMTPGSFHSRVFPSDFLHFVHTSNSAHWLSQVPKGLRKENGELINKGNIYISNTSDPDVLVAYQQQFEEDFTSFLVSRAQEIVTAGRMVLNIMASTDSYAPKDYFMTDVLNLALKDMVKEGLIDETMLDDFEIPFYPPTREEVVKVIEAEGSFRIHKHETFIIDWDDLSQGDNNEIDFQKRVKFVTGPIKAGSECMMAAQFGENLMEDLYDRVTNLIAMRLLDGTILKAHHQCISLIKNEK